MVGDDLWDAEDEVVLAALLQATEEEHSKLTEETQNHIKKAEKLLSANGLERVDIPRDGNCLFRAIASLLQCPDKYDEIRALCAQYFEENFSHYSNFFTTSIDPSFLKQCLSRKSVWNHGVNDLLPNIVANLMQTELIIFSSLNNVTEVKPTVLHEPWWKLTEIPRRFLLVHLVVPGHEHYDIAVSKKPEVQSQCHGSLSSDVNRPTAESSDQAFNQNAKQCAIDELTECTVHESTECTFLPSPQHDTSVSKEPEVQSQCHGSLSRTDVNRPTAQSSDQASNLNAKQCTVDESTECTTFLPSLQHDMSEIRCLGNPMWCNTNPNDAAVQSSAGISESEVYTWPILFTSNLTDLLGSDVIIDTNQEDVACSTVIPGATTDLNQQNVSYLMHTTMVPEVSADTNQQDGVFSTVVSVNGENGVIFLTDSRSHVNDQENIGQNQQNIETIPESSLKNIENAQENSIENIENALVNDKGNMEPSENMLSSCQVDKAFKGRKRLASPHDWKQNKRKALRNIGQEYVTAKGKVVQARKVKPSKCKHTEKYNCLRCSDVPEEKREIIFTEFWQQGDLAKRRQFLLKCIDEQDCRRMDKLALKHKETTRLYHFIVEGEKIRVCKQFFMDTLDICSKFIETTLHKVNMQGFLEPEGRGQHVHSHKMKPKTKEFVKKHIESFPAMESHYCRASSSRKYLQSTLNIAKLYEDYKQKAEAKHVEKVSATSYRYIFNTEYNLAFHKPKKDQCNICTSYQKLEVVSTEDTEKYEMHIQKKDRARLEKSNEIVKAEQDKSRRVATFDLQAVLHTPSSEVSTLYYVRKLAVYNFTVFENITKRGMCFIWNETEGKRGSCEIGSCLLRYIASLPSEVKNLTLFSDNCPGQNRNRNVASMLFHTLHEGENKHLDVIEQKFLTTGHTQMECDSMHSSIERAKKFVEIYEPDGWLNILRMARRKTPYQVIPLSFEDFYDFRILSQSLKFGNIHFSDVVALKVERSNKKIGFKYKFDEDYQYTKALTHKGKLSELQNLYGSKLGVSKPKKKDLVRLCKLNVIPSQYHKFYENLPTTEMEDRLPDPDILESDCDSD